MVRRDEGISALKVHPVESLFAVAEQGTTPSILVFSWPKLEIIKRIRLKFNISIRKKKKREFDVH